MSVISPVSNSTGSTQAISSNTLGKDDFLQLMITKMQYQDPLNPMEDADFIAQLAQFSSLEQMNNIAEGIAASNEWDFLQMQSINNTMATGLIGKDIKATYNGLYVDAVNKPQITYSTDEFVTNVEFTVRDTAGNSIVTLRDSNVDPGVNSIEWDGRDSLGNRVEHGYYTIEASATNGSGQTIQPRLSLIGTVETIVYREGAAFLRVNGTEIPLGDVTAVGELGSFDEDEA
jgi:flagellar basal-body rod modification protein FlgD